MKNALLVPIHLDALVLKNDRTVVEPMADFTRLPYLDGKRNFNPDIANISEEILSQPFQDLGFQLKPGVHLHWALPDGLTRGVGQAAQDKGNQKRKVSFPVVPNRWLVTRIDQAGQKKQWIIESDYLYPPGAGDQSSGISYPYPKNGQNAQPFRSMGRAMPLAAWQNRDDAPPAQYLNREQSPYPLTAVGYGEPTFAAFYPNCHSVFGFYDDYDRQPLPDLNGVQYDYWIEVEGPAIPGAACKVYRRYKLPLLRMATLSKNVLLCLFDGIVEAIDLHLKPETLHFGVDVNPGTRSFSKKLRDAQGKENSSIPVPQNGTAHLVISIAQMADDMRKELSKKDPQLTAFTSAEFALQMIEGVEKVRLTQH